MATSRQSEKHQLDDGVTGPGRPTAEAMIKIALAVTAHHGSAATINSPERYQPSTRTTSEATNDNMTYETIFSTRMLFFSSEFILRSNPWEQASKREQKQMAQELMRLGGDGKVSTQFCAVSFFCSPSNEHGNTNVGKTG